MAILLGAGELTWWAVVHHFTLAITDMHGHSTQVTFVWSGLSVQGERESGRAWKGHQSIRFGF